jgi:YVTN family beta-propeller protein
MQVGRFGVLSLAVIVSACGGVGPSAPIASSEATASLPSPKPTVVATAQPATPSPAPPSPTSPPTPPPGGIYWATVGSEIAPALADIPARVYVPNEKGAEVVVIDPATFQIVDRFGVGKYPEHITPDWDGQRLLVNDMLSHTLTVIDPRTARPTGTKIEVPFPYNLYFSPDGSIAIIVEDFTEGAPAADNGLRFYDRSTWKELGFLPIPWAGADHMDFSADGATAFLSCEYSGRIVSVDVKGMKVNGSLFVGGSSTDVRLGPDGTTLYVANQVRNGLDVVNATTFEYLSFIPLERGTHGLAMSRDATRLFVTNRWAGSLSAIDMASNEVVSTWQIGGTPDMIATSPDGTQLWISNRYSGSISVVNSGTGEVISTIATGANPHGLVYWPQPGRYSLGHNGNMR